MFKTPKYVSKHFHFTAVPWRSINHRKKAGHIIYFGSSDICVLHWGRSDCEDPGHGEITSFIGSKWWNRLEEAGCVSSLQLRRKCSLREERSLQPWPHSATQKLCRWLQGSSFKPHQEGVPSWGQVLPCWRCFLKYYYQKNN